MRVVRAIPHAECRITIFAWNNRYIIKLEHGHLEQTFKLDESEIQNEEELLKVVDAEFVQQALTRFEQMGQSFYEAVQRGVQ